MSFFTVTHKDKNSNARTGVIKTAHGEVETPTFMPVGTQATVKSLDPRDIKEVGATIILANTYHLHLRPGEDLIADFGGLHKFMKWNGPILTDSGGFQVFSLGKRKSGKTAGAPLPLKGGDHASQSERAEGVSESLSHSQGNLVKIDNDGVTFRSHIDGSEHRFTPEKAIDIQHKLGADIIMAFDECTPDSASREYTKEALERTHQWAERSLEAHQQFNNFNNLTYKQYLFGIIQGANHKELREESAKIISSLDFDGIAIGGESIGYNMEATKNILSWVMPLIPEDKPHYTMGVGSSPTDLFDVVEHGVDMFDCVAPTRQARNGTLYSRNKVPSPERGGSGRGYERYRLNITNAQYKADKSPIDPNCDCSTCTTFSRSYIHHLFDANEILAQRLATIHNVRFMLKLMEEMRAAIRNDKFIDLKKEWM